MLWRVVLVAAVALSALAVDVALPRGVASGLLYMLVVALGLLLPWRNAAAGLAALCTVLTVIAVAFKENPLEVTESAVLTNRVLIIFALWLTAALVMSYSRAQGAELRLRSVLATAPDAIVVIDEGGRIVSFNSAAARMFGYGAEEAIGLDVGTLAAAQDRASHPQSLARYLRTGRRRLIGFPREVVAQRKDGGVFPAMLNVDEVRFGRRRLFTGFIRDLTAEKDAQRRLADAAQKSSELQTDLIHIARQAELSEMGSLLAHELNQPLAAIGNYLGAYRDSLALAKVAIPEKSEEILAKAVQQADRAAQTIRRLRAYLQKGEEQRSSEDVAAVVREAGDIAMMGRRVRSAELVIECAGELPEVEMDRVQIQQVLVNLIRNACDALSDRFGGKIVARAEPVQDGVSISVADNGPGLAPEVRDRIFLPFVTTKPSGMGIGLWVSRTIVEAHGGRLTVDTSELGGARFCIALPRSADGSIRSIT